MKRKKYFIRMLIFLAVLCIAVVGVLGIEVYAGGAPAVKSNIDAFDALTGDQRYVQDRYFDSYALDQEELDTFDFVPAIVDGVAEILFWIIKKLAQVTVTIFYFCMDFDIAELFKDQLNAIQGALHETIFEPLFILAFCFSGVTLFKKFLKRDLMGAYGQLIRVIFLVVLSILIVHNSASVLSTATSIAKNVGTQAITGVNGNGQNSGSFAAQSAGVLWLNLVHQPWVTIEFGNDNVDSATIAKFMNPVNASGTESREKLVADYTGTAFSKDRAGEKLGFMIMYLFPFLFKCLIYIAVSLIQLVFQFMAIFYVVLAPVILILSMFPGYEGMIGSWLRKILESQLSIVLITFLLGLLIKFDEMLFALSKSFGWLIVIVIQICVEAGVILKREALLNTFSNIQKGMSTPGYATAAMKRSGDVRNGAKSVQAMARQAKKDVVSVKKMPARATAAVKQTATRVANSRPVTMAAKGVAAGAGLVSAAVGGSMEAKRLTALNSYAIDKKSGGLVQGRTLEQYQEDKAAKEARAEKRWQKKVENYNSTKKKAPPIKKSYVMKPTKWENMQVVESVKQTSEMERTQSVRQKTAEAPANTQQPSNRTNSMVVKQVVANRNLQNSKATEPQKAVIAQKEVQRPKSSMPPQKVKTEASENVRRPSGSQGIRKGKRA